MPNYVTKALQNFQHPPHDGPNLNPINGRAQIMVLQSNCQISWVLHHQYQREKSAGFKKSWALSYIMHVLCTALFCQPPTQYMSNTRTQLIILKLISHIYWTIHPLILKWYSNLKIVLWCYTLTEMHNNSPNHRHAAALEFTTTLALNHPTLQKLRTSHPQKMDQYIQNVEYWYTLWLPLLNQKLVNFSTMGKFLYP